VRRPAITAALVLAAVTAGCGKEDKPLRTVTVQGGEDIRVKGEEYSFDPGRVVVRAAAKRISITLVNEGSLAHNLTILDGDRELAGVRSFPAGEERTLKLEAPPGSYRMVCTVADHEDLGMTGRLELQR
jgi:plastocyanin